MGSNRRGGVLPKSATGQKPASVIDGAKTSNADVQFTQEISKVCLRRKKKQFGRPAKKVNKVFAKFLKIPPRENHRFAPEEESR